MSSKESEDENILAELYANEPLASPRLHKNCVKEFLGTLCYCFATQSAYVAGMDVSAGLNTLNGTVSSLFCDAIAPAAIFAALVFTVMPW